MLYSGDRRIDRVKLAKFADFGAICDLVGRGVKTQVRIDHLLTCPIPPGQAAGAGAPGD